MNIKLGDFGLAAQLLEKDEKWYTICGTPNYLAPEILIHKGHSFEVDLWSLGIIIYTLLTGNHPFETANVNLTYKKIKKGYFEFPKDHYLHDYSIDLINKLLVKDPS